MLCFAFTALSCLTSHNSITTGFAMDLKSFSGDSFDSKDWINAAFRLHQSQQSDPESREQFASSVVMKLQLLISKLNASLEEQSEAMCSNMPRVVRETESIQVSPC